jgi:hypothetical protein
MSSRISGRRHHESERLLEYLLIDRGGKLILRDRQERWQLARKLEIDLGPSINALLWAGSINARYVGGMEILEAAA